jgi:hypothetical protein
MAGKQIHPSIKRGNGREARLFGRGGEGKNQSSKFKEISKSNPQARLELGSARVGISQFLAPIKRLCRS